MDNKVAYEMVLALLEHQLSSPVQWIATQDSLLSMQKQHQRYVEIGPSNTLSTMMKKTMAQNGDVNGDQELPQCLTYADELEAIRKASEPEPEVEEEEISADVLTDSAAPQAAPEPVAVAAPVVQAASVAEIEDVPPTAAEAVVTMVAAGLKIARDGVDVTQSIKFLAKGRSALQNEIVGNLTAEFGQVPEAVETTPITELCQDLQRTYSGKLGTFLGEWLTKRVSAKLAPSISVSKLRARLRNSYGLKQGHQDSFFLTANFDEIASRLADEQESWKKVQQWADSFLRARGLQRVEAPVQQQGAAQPGSQTEQVNSPQLAKFASDLAALMSKHFKSSSEDQSQDTEAPSADDAEVAKHLADELGAEFISGTKSYFRPEMVYRYQSGWNWAVQDLYVTLSGVITRVGTMPEEDLQLWIQAQCERLRERRTDRLLQCAHFLLEKWEKESDSKTSQCCLLLLRDILRDDEPLSATNLQSYVAPSRKTIPKTKITEEGEIIYREVPAEAMSLSNKPLVSEQNSSWDSFQSVPTSDSGEDTSGSLVSGGLWPVRLLTKGKAGEWETNPNLTSQLHEAERHLGIEKALPVEGTTLIIGAGQRSIGFMLARLLLQAGSRVALCTGRLTPENRKVISQMYAKSAKPGAELVLLPFNQGSVQDINNMVSYINDTLGWEIDHLVPFAAISTNGKNLEDVDSVSELALRIMLTNTLRLMGSIVASKRRRHVLNHSTQVLVPLSPNHGQYGNDGLYAESKLALEALLNKAASEPWGDTLTICGVRMGWARGTGLMTTNDVFAESIEKLGARTFSAEEMATLLALVMTPDLTEACIMEPVLCDFTGGLGAVPNMGSQISSIRASIQDKVVVRKQLKQEADHDENVLNSRSRRTQTLMPSETRAKMHNSFPALPESYKDAIPRNASDLKDLYDLDSMVVITGFGELGSAGSSRTRWELEAEGEFSIEGCIELAWMMGFIKYERRRLHNGTDAGPGWVEIESGSPIKDLDVKAKFEARIREHTGIRILETDEWSNPDPRLRDMLHEVGTQEDLPPFDCSSQAAEDLKRRHGDAIEVLSDDGSSASVRIRSGATIFVPKAMNTAYFVGAQVPQGWDAARYGIPQEVSAQTDRPGLFALVCAVEAFLSAGITDVYELYRYIHVSEVGNCIGSGAGGLPAFQRMHEHRLLGREVPNDNLSEAFVGTAAAWLNLLLLSASGPLKTGAGTCATSLESLDTACELISGGKTKVCLAGGYDVFTRPIYYEFGEINAIIDAAHDEQCGRAPKEMSRPFTTTRSGFVLGEGIGIQVLTSASLALEMGLPIYGIVAMTHMASDKLGRSAPAPGRGILTAAKQPSTLSAGAKGLMNPALRSKLVKAAVNDIEFRSRAQVDAVGAADGTLTAEDTDGCIQSLKSAAELEKKAVRRALGQDYWKSNPSISPIAGSLSVFGLTVDDITFASLHGTATKLNDVNEAATLDHQMRHLGRRAGNPLFTIAQKSVIGHGLGASGAYAINGGLQAMHAGVIPGNRNADDIDKKLEDFEQLLLTNEKITLRGEDMKAFSVTSFGFGQKGAQALIVHPKYLFAAIAEERYNAYRLKQIRRSRLAARELDRGLHGQGMFKAKEELPYTGDEYEYMLNPNARRE
ncbi:fatty acid synthase subunit alpha [Diaporthe amygdali]|uniref:fatty acid synthase subunit alpha n=1 Tax=Phomopsis amygdali TaxID=1214568 RepID=UPI0022FF4125|nr:fatty acid synthase subunit alpha [Diaporthe amygdali]KAJ0122096.1 fatty acid synthase subunit alpha [Diaporthe amygdali]